MITQKLTEHLTIEMEDKRDSGNGEIPITNVNVTANADCESDIPDDIVSAGTKDSTDDKEKVTGEG